MGRASSFAAVSWAVLGALVLPACGGSQPPAETAAEATVTSTADSAGAAEVWRDDMPEKEKALFMKNKVVPAMAQAFQAFDAKKYESFGCKTCHGPTFKPHPAEFLPELHVKDGQLTEAAEHPALATFMKEQVTPQMAALFGKPLYDPATNQGFGCGGCHKVNR